jgi:small subunit ribosomal protein S1
MSTASSVVSSSSQSQIANRNSQISKKKLAANRANASKSTGPRTRTGKSRSSQNRTTHGMYSPHLCLPRENKKLFHAHRHAIIARLDPRDAVELLLVERIVSAGWKLRRLQTTEMNLYEHRAFELREMLLQKQSRDTESRDDGDAPISPDEAIDTSPLSPAETLAISLAAANSRSETSFERLERFEQRLENSLARGLRQLHQLRSHSKPKSPTEELLHLFGPHHNPFLPDDFQFARNEPTAPHRKSAPTPFPTIDNAQPPTDTASVIKPTNPTSSFDHSSFGSGGEPSAFDSSFWFRHSDFPTPPSPHLSSPANPRYDNPSFPEGPMSKKIHEDVYKEKFRPADALDQEVAAALGDLKLDDLYAVDRKGPAQTDVTKGTRRGRVVKVGKDDLFVDFGGKSQGIASLIQFGAEIPEVGTEMEFNVDRFDPREGLLILTIKGATATGVTWENLEIGQIVEATVTGTNKGGLELEVKNMRAFMPAGQVELFHVPDFAQYVGQKMIAEVTQFEREAKNLILSRRNILEREREEQKIKLIAELAEGQIRRGTVRNVMDFGAFVDLGGADGLLHVSEMSFQRGRKATDFVKVGDVLDVKIIRLDKETGKMSLSLKQARGTDPWADAANKYSVGTSITGRIVKVESFGAFVEVEEGVDGLLPVSEMSYQRIKHPSDLVKDGDTVKLVVISIDPLSRKMSFSLKQAGPNPWQTVHEKYATDSIVPGTITRLMDFGAFVELEPGLEGLIHVSELSNARVRTPADIVKPGQEVKVRILEIDKDGRRIGLSLKRVAELEAMQSAGTAPAAPKKKRPELRGGLDFDFKKNK